MNVYSIAEEIRTALATIPGLRVPVWGARELHPPAAVVAAPDSVMFDATYGRGQDSIDDWPVVVLVGLASERTAWKQLAPFADGSGASSIKAKLDGYAWTACDTLIVASVDFADQATYAGTPYLAAEFHLKITGKGA